MDLKSIGKRIREKRLQNSWSQEDLAEKTGLTPVYIGMIERGEKIPKLETFVKIANVLRATSDELMQDVLVQGYVVKTSNYCGEIEKLEENDKRRLYGIIEAFLRTE